MPHESASHETTFGYLSVLDSAEHGYFGGYLIVSSLGRPLEFHCTAPVRPSGAQRILYGATLEPYLVGDQIAGALLEAAKLRPVLILADREASLLAADRTDAPFVQLYGNSESSADRLSSADFASDGLDASTGLITTTINTSPADGTFTVSSYNFQLPAGHESERDRVARYLAELAMHVDLGEPFHRIEEAIREAQRLGGRGADIHDQAA
jgi:hypothetical protein